VDLQLSVSLFNIINLLLQSMTSRLDNSEEEKSMLLETITKNNKESNFVAEIAFKNKLTNKHKLHKLCPVLSTSSSIFV
jgi:hypothetical protein